MSTKCAMAKTAKFLAVIFLPVTLSTVTAVGQVCADTTTTVYVVNSPITRVDGNTVRAYASSSISGNYSNKWLLYLSTWLYKDSSLLTQDINKSTGQLGASVSTQYMQTLQSSGPGQYYMDSYHSGYAPECNIAVPPYANGFNGWLSSPALTVSRPVISSQGRPTFLGAGITQSNDYSNQSTLSIDPKGAPEAPTWTITAGSNSATLSCSPCVTPTLTVTAAPNGCNANGIVVKASFNGFDSDSFGVDSRTPDLMQHYATNHYNPLPSVGWQSEEWYKVVDNCGEVMTNIQMNEVFTSWNNYNGSNWMAPLDAYGFANLKWEAGAASWLLKDIMYEIQWAGKSPQPMVIGTNGYSEQPQDVMTRHFQKWRAGSAYNGGPSGIPSGTGSVAGNDAVATGVFVGSNNHTHYLDHGRHN